ncbi:hypothetical protein HIM_06739 [Hirsutella minnesotensis 3608]|uniref:Uncharacterized protein n=1 Tax=Hirsutella minnesotensis 3608 TaxID=1043627 RepID=A0A0F7ZIM3_9HYPO|nr:hypothetical protein HIM_06739 [Hirsutella minnesotensis 3608]
MARFVDLEGANDRDLARQAALRLASADAGTKARDDGSGGSLHRPYVTNVMTEAFACYPVAIAVASNIDLNTLDALARTSRGIHDGLIQYRTILLSSTLRCSNEADPVNRDELLRYRARASNWHYMDDGRSFNGKSGNCARDMVDGCRRCGDVICRNCAIKPPAPIALRDRHRRLCLTCSRAPIATLIDPPLDSSASFGSEAIQRGICSCAAKGVWLCQPCGRGIRAADHEYQRIWRWRNHYGEILGGLGTGIGDGDRGVICGREEDCLAAREREHEIDCDAEDARDADAAPWSSGMSSSPTSATASTASTTSPTSTTSTGHHASTIAGMPLGNLHINDMRPDGERTSSPQLGPGYERHEIEGIGGRVKRKLVRMVRVGACVPEWDEEERVGSRVLGREVAGDTRAWCGWCWRVIPSNKDAAMGDSR